MAFPIHKTHIRAEAVDVVEVDAQILNPFFAATYPIVLKSRVAVVDRYANGVVPVTTVVGCVAVNLTISSVDNGVWVVFEKLRGAVEACMPGVGVVTDFEPRVLTGSREEFLTRLDEFTRLVGITGDVVTLVLFNQVLIGILARFG